MEQASPWALPVEIRAGPFLFGHNAFEPSAGSYRCQHCVAHATTSVPILPRDAAGWMTGLRAAIIHMVAGPPFGDEAKQPRQRAGFIRECPASLALKRDKQC